MPEKSEGALSVVWKSFDWSSEKPRQCFSFFTLLAALLLSGCSTPQGVVLKETPLGISETRRIISSVTGIPRMISENGRELYSQFFDRKGRVDDFLTARERLYSRVTILGERRPYNIEVLVIIQNKQADNKFLDVGHDMRRSEELAEKIRAALNESRDKRNIIDDFKPY